MQRWYGQVERIRPAPPAKGDADEPEALDKVLAFFSNCYHLADWIAKDRADPHPDVWDFVKRTDDLLVCRDLCNGSKHCVLEARYKPTYPGATTTAETIIASGPIQWWIDVNPGDRRDIFDLAEGCMEAWRNFIDRFPASKE